MNDIEDEVQIVEEKSNDDDKRFYGTLDEDKIAFSRLCELLANVFGLMYDKFSSENLSVRWDKKGHNAE